LSPEIPPLLQKIVQALEDKKGIDIQVFDMRDVVSYTDFLILCSAASPAQVHALVDNVRESLQKPDWPVYVNFSKDDSWMILDFVDIVLHVFKEDVRRFYNLESLWADAKRLELASSR
jgi:ribosome-associated protein